MESNEIVTADPSTTTDAADAEVERKIAVLTKFERYEYVEIHRGLIKAAPYNPRVMVDKARQHLKTIIKGKGLVEPLVWNKRSSNLVGGHQRLSILDALEGNQNYLLHVSQVDLDDKEEKELNVALNNPQAQGDWDMSKLEIMIKEDKIGIAESGFDMGGIFQLFGDTPLIEQPEALQAIADQLRATKEKMGEVQEQNRGRDDSNYYLIVVFADHGSRKAFTDSLGLDDNRFVDGRELLKLILKGE